MNDRQRDIIEAAVDAMMPYVQGRTREQIGEDLYNLVLDCQQPPRLSTHNESTRRSPAAGEVLPPHQRASWARKMTPHDLIVPEGAEAPATMGCAAAR